MTDQGAELPLTDHLQELRKRLLYAVVAILVASSAAFALSDQLIKLLLIPAGNLQLNAFNIMDGFMIKWQVALYAGIAVAFPIWAYQIYAFVKPGLYEHEQRAVFPLLAGSLVLFILGVIFGYNLLSAMIKVMIKFFPTEVTFLPAAGEYIGFVVFFLLACGICFQIPTLIIILVQLKIINTNMLRKQRKIAYFGLFVFAELITPVSDPIVAPLTVMVPLIILYEVSIFLARRIENRRAKEELALNNAQTIK